MSEKRRGRKLLSRSGKNCHFWRGGITKESKKIRMGTDIRMWRRSVFERDNYTCKICGERGGVLNADHIKPFSLYPELRFDINNGRTLCETCHRKTPTYGGRISVKNKTL
jgi:5-methylcytosine-specific restriction endonuclease McrA